MRVWRLLVDGAAPGPWNMGVDEALLAKARCGSPSLRFYRWQGPWLSLGYALPLSAAIREACEAQGVGIVRRATGGGAVLHGCDLTYSLAAPPELLPGGIDASSSRIALGLMTGLRSLGFAVDVAAPRASRNPMRRFDCFSVVGAREIVSQGRKLCGSAQRRLQGAILQHGSLRLAADPVGASRAAGLDPRVSTHLGEAGPRCSIDQLVGALLSGLEEALQARFEPEGLSPGELDAAHRRGPEAPGSCPVLPQEAL